MTLFGDTITPAHTAQARYFLDTAAIVSVVGASVVLLLAIALLIVDRARRWKGPAVAILLAGLSTFLPVFFALHGQLAGE
jgi:Na+-translocating ferredoxin:NAD+ oxidoreductase RnfD subunit